MARLRGAVTTEGEIALSAATAKTVLQVVAATNVRVAIQKIGIAFDGVSATAEPVQVDLVKQTDAGTSSAATPVHKLLGASETLQTTARKTATVEPTTTDVIRRFEVHPQTGKEFSFGPDDEIVLGGGTRLVIRLTAPAVVNAVAFIEFEE